MLCLALPTACTYSPWSAYHYQDPKMVEFWSDNLPPQTHEYEEYFIGTTFVRSFLRAHDQGDYQASSPYGFFVNVYGVTGRHERMTIHSVRMISSLGTEYEIRPVELSNRGGFVSDLALPYSENFHLMISDKRRSWASMRTGYDLDLQAAAGEHIITFVDVEVETISGVERKSVRYEFAPVFSEGSFKWVDVWDSNKK